MTYGMKVLTQLILALVLVASTPTSFAQEVTIPDPGLNAAIHDALHKPVGPLTQQDLAILTVLDAHKRGITSIQGLESALNLRSLDLQDNHLVDFTLPGSLTNLTILNVSVNGMTNCVLPGGLSNLGTLILEGNSLTRLELPPGLVHLASLDVDGNDITHISLPTNLTSLTFLDLSFNSLSQFSFPDGLTNLGTLNLRGNVFTNFAVPAGLTSLTELDVSENQLAGFTLPIGYTNLLALDLSFNQLQNLNLPPDLVHLTELYLDGNQFSELDLPAHLNRLADLHLRSCLLTHIDLPDDLTSLNYLDVGENRLSELNLPASLSQLAFLRASGNNFTSLIFPAGLTNLTGVFLRYNQLTNVTLPPDLRRLASFDAIGNQIASLDLPVGLTSLTSLYISGNGLTNITLPPDMTQLSSLVPDGNPLTSLVLSDSLASSTLSADVTRLRGQGVSIFTYPVAIQLGSPRETSPAVFEFTISGPPGHYVIVTSTDLITWNAVGMTTNALGDASYSDEQAGSPLQRFYRAVLQAPPIDMVFISATTFVMGSPATEQERSADESPQTTVKLSHGYWIGRHEVTQREYLSIMNSNPSSFPGDLNLPISSVSWIDATNYCAKLTQRDLGTGRIPPGSVYRLPTEAEWECAARAGTTTRFSFGDDPDYSILSEFAWNDSSGPLGPHPVGQKLPNPWGLYDMAGNVWEWCSDWYGPLPGGVQTDPTGPASNSSDWKVMKGGAYDYTGSSFRSATRGFYPVGISLNDADLGFRVVLQMGPI